MSEESEKPIIAVSERTLSLEICAALWGVIWVAVVGKASRPPESFEGDLDSLLHSQGQQLNRLLHRAHRLGHFETDALRTTFEDFLPKQAHRVTEPAKWLAWLALYSGLIEETCIEDDRLLDFENTATIERLVAFGLEYQLGKLFEALAGTAALRDAEPSFAARSVIEIMGYALRITMMPAERLPSLDFLYRTWRVSVLVEKLRPDRGATPAIRKALRQLARSLEVELA